MFNFKHFFLFVYVSLAIFSCVMFSLNTVFGLINQTPQLLRLYFKSTSLRPRKPSFSTTIFYNDSSNMTKQCRKFPSEIPVARLNDQVVYYDTGRKTAACHTFFQFLFKTFARPTSLIDNIFGYPCFGVYLLLAKTFETFKKKIN